MSLREFGEKENARLLEARTLLRARLAAAEAERAQLQSIVEGSQDAIWTWALDGTILRWNARAESLLGYSAGEIVGRSLTVLVPPEHHEAAKRAIDSLKSGTSYSQLETVRLSKDGTPIEVELTVSPIVGPDGTIVGGATVGRDIRERKRVEAALARRMAELSILARLSERLQLAGNLNEIYDAALDAITTALACPRASILLFDGLGIMRFVGWRGLSDSYRSAVDGHSPWTPDMVSATPIWVEDILQSNESDALKKTITNEGIRGLAFIPLVTGGRLIGKFMCYYSDPHTFNAHEVNLAITIARQLALAIARKSAEQELKESEGRFRLMSEHAPVMIWMSDAQGRCLHLNAMLRQFWGVPEDGVGSFDWQAMMHPQDAADITQRIMRALEGRESLTLKGRYRAVSGEYRVLQTAARPRFSSSGEFLGMIGTNVDITEQEKSEQALRESEQRFRLAVEASPSGMVMTDRHGMIVLVNSQAETLFGYTRDEIVGRNIEQLVPDRFRDQHPMFREAYGSQPSARPMGEGRDLFARRKDGSEVPVDIGLSPIHTPEGQMVMAAIVDISARKRAESHRELLVAELNHRVKNTLAVVQGIAYQTFRAGNGPPELRKAFEERLVALAQAHNLLTESSWEHASIKQLAEVTTEALGANEKRVALSGPDLHLPPKQAVPLAMALHELCTNAKKYGALSNEDGRIVLDWSIARDEGAVLNLAWRECNGPPVSPPARRGFGTTLLERTLAQDLEGEVMLRFHPDGLECVISAPMRDISEGRG
jgi:PAS domain S-box-containing protein